MYLVHWPIRLKPWACNAVPKEEDFEKQLDMETTWEGMQKCLDMGLCRCIGVSNFSTKKIEHLLDFASVPPAVNQVYICVCDEKNQNHKIMIETSHYQTSIYTYGKGQPKVNK